ncbi:hypothetical protein PybrP1_003003, partial [[Pythium] brassicae (nom. inval.)]
MALTSPREETSLVRVRISDITQAFVDFLNQLSDRKTVFRLIRNREVVSQIQDFHKGRAANGNLADYLFSEEKNRRK